MASVPWRPDGGELVFASNYEADCSWYTSDLYAILADGSGYRRITNAPTCATLANYNKGTVKLTVPGADTFAQIYIQGAPSVKNIPPGGGVVTFDNVADLGAIGQPIVIIQGKYRFMTDALVDVKAGQTVEAQVGTVTTTGMDLLGAYGPAWKRDGSRIGYTFGCAEIYGIADQPSAGNIGQPLFNTTAVTPCVMAWGPTASTANQLIYYNDTSDRGIYRVTEGSSNAGTLLIPNSYTDVNYVFKIQYLPDASGILFSRPDNGGAAGNVYRYNFASNTLTQLTFYTNQFARDFAISPDGQTIVYELASFDWQCVWGCGSDLWIMQINGSNQQLFKAGGAHPSWSLGAAPQALSKLYLPLVKR